MSPEYALAENRTGRIRLAFGPPGGPHTREFPRPSKKTTLCRPLMPGLIRGEVGQIVSRQSIVRRPEAQYSTAYLEDRTDFAVRE